MIECHLPEKLKVSVHLCGCAVAPHWSSFFPSAAPRTGRWGKGSNRKFILEVMYLK